MDFGIEKIFNVNKAPARIVGVDIGTSSVKIVVLKTGKKPSIIFSSVIDTGKDSSDDDISAKIEKALKDGSVAVKEASLTFGGGMAAFRRIELPATVPQAEAADALKWKAKETVDFNIENAYSAFKLLKEVQMSDGTKSNEYIFLAVEKEAMDRKIEVLKKAGLEVVSVNVHPFGFENIFRTYEEKSVPKIAMVADIGFERTEISIFRSGNLEFVRPIPVGSANVTSALQETISTDSGDVSFTEEEAEGIKRSVGIAYEAVTLDKGVESVQILSLMRPTLEQILKEIRRSIEYYSHEYGAEGAAISVFLAGGGSRLKNLARYLGEELGIEVQTFSPASFYERANEAVSVDDFCSIAAITGVVSGYGNQIDLVPRKYKVERFEFVEKVALRMAVVVILAILGSSYLFTKLKVEDYRGRLKTVPFQKDMLAGVTDLQSKVLEREAFISKVRESNLDMEKMMKELSNIVPQGVVLSTLRMSLRDKTMDMSGAFHGPRSTAEAVITKFMEDMEKSRCFRDAQLSSVQGQGGQGQDFSSFTINCSLE